jgi:putative SOS response-associated peptidase YedK
MCARYCLREQNPLIADLFELDEIPYLEPAYNIAPTHAVPVVVCEPKAGRSLRLMRWGLIPSWSKDPFRGSPLINARSETVMEKPAFRAPVRRRRCLIPASGYFEWRLETGGKQPYFIHLADGSPIAFAGIWEVYESPDAYLETCAMLTTDANDMCAFIHDRMPVIVPRELHRDWVDPYNEDPHGLLHVLGPYHERPLAMHKVDKRVGNPKFNHPEALLPVNETLLDFEAKS